MRRWHPLAAPVLPCQPQFSSLHHSTSRPFRLGIAAFLGLAVLSAPGALAAEVSRGSGPSEVIFLTQIIVLLLVGRLMGEAMQRIGQPAVMGQLIAGLLLGPSVLGALWPEAQHALFPPSRDQKSMIDAVSQLGVLMLLLLTGMETDLSLIRKAPWQPTQGLWDRERTTRAFDC
jgi:sodium/hydrogen exchanger family protein